MIPLSESERKELIATVQVGRGEFSSRLTDFDIMFYPEKKGGS